MTAENWDLIDLSIRKVKLFYLHNAVCSTDIWQFTTNKIWLWTSTSKAMEENTIKRNAILIE